MIVAEPSATAVTTPSETVATAVLSLDHVTDLFEAPSGLTVAVSVSVPPTLRFTAGWSSDMPETGVVVGSKTAVILVMLLLDTSYTPSFIEFEVLLVSLPKML